ncbi:20346_t:CDS:2 [Funneliformis geosporum]|uniref:11771_t:CDS:1 n=1 Tax=Funneliformis geosporum TaxID=1117311 RepID=A0A9W4WUE1_9GLOM|nr:11771_t:CDS:2 [Funneliformis geosporum]CAI2166851.1 20346_t:CDS:2 [Funneliformis geosporum]
MIIFALQPTNVNAGLMPQPRHIGSIIQIIHLRPTPCQITCNLACFSCLSSAIMITETAEDPFTIGCMVAKSICMARCSPI